MTRRTLLVASAAAAVGLAAVAGAVRVSAHQGTKVPTTRVRRGDLSIDVYTRGEFRATRSAMLVAPQAPGSLQIVSLAKTVARVRERDVVVEFDPAERVFIIEDTGEIQCTAENFVQYHTSLEVTMTMLLKTTLRI